jgi:hypothetical protein
MTLSITGSNILIQNTNGTTKFTSADKLVYLKAANTGTFTISPSAPTVIMPFGASITSEKDFFMMNIKFNSCTGNGVVSSTINLLNRYLPANGAVFINFHAFRNFHYMDAESEILTSGLVGSNIYFKGAFSNIYDSVTQGIEHTSNITYKAYIYSYL